MKYSDYTTEQIVSQMYEKVAEKIINLANDEETKMKLNGILYDGGFEDFSVNGSNHMERRISYKNNPTIEGRKRLNMAYLLLKNPQVIETIQESGGYFFHGTNANALSSILKYGINSVDTSMENKINVNTGEKWSRVQGKRSFVSITDCLDVALGYSDIAPSENSNINNLMNFGVVLGVSLKDMNGIETVTVTSDISELGIQGNLSLDHIKYLIVPGDKTEFVKKMVGSKNIEVISMDMQDKFYRTNFLEKFNILEQQKEDSEKLTQQYPIYTKEDVMPVVNKRKISKIKEVFNDLKRKIHIHTKDTNERG